MSRVLNVVTPSSAEYLQVLELAWSEAKVFRPSDAPTVISCFAAGGGSSLGYQMAGYRELLATVWDERSVETLRLNFPELNVWHGEIAGLSVVQVRESTGCSGSSRGYCEDSSHAVSSWRTWLRWSAARCGWSSLSACGT